MFKRFLTSGLAILVFNLSFGTIAFAQTQDDKEAQRERDAQIFVNRLGTGEKSRVKVSFKDGSKSVKGYISEINDDSFVVTDKKKNTNTTLQFAGVKKVSKDPSRTRTLLIAGGVFLGIVIGVGLICLSSGRCED